MKEQFDKKLAEKIKDSFSKHEEPFDPQAWEKFSRAYFKPKKKAWLVYWPFLTAGVAASLLFFFIYFPEQERIDQQVKSFSDSITIGDAPFQSKMEEDTANEDDQAELEAMAEAVEKPALGSPEEIAGIDTDAETPKSPVSNRKSEVLPEVSAMPSLIKPFAESWEDFQAVMVEKLKQLPLFGEQDILDQPANLSMTENDAVKIIEEWKSGEVEKETKDLDKDSRPFKLGVMVSPQANSNPVSGMNLGAGIMSEISLSNKFKLDFGLAYANQSLSHQNMQPMPQNASPGFDLRASSNIIDTNYQLNFASLDIPVNLKYRVYDKKQTGIYLITGLSSMVYLDQNSVETIEAQSLFSTNSFSGDLEYAPNVQKFSNVISPQSGQSNTDMAGLLNLSIGYEYQLNNEFYLSFEPFYKLPLGGLTFADQQFSIGGINLRMNFNLKNK
ncbi:outer membrane beta-barrel protein [Cyclobacterium plantarum]|uniref:Outer membrane beta-barrel protein n=1 Tax=Cyclobacterium plantarum TaxID=2716263 RepID=A0ABX0H0K1_9BACT|nr:outer membrane beta-barrel protein [Cyclobacterium plantarum]NHE55303.1 outer membrane beta-barrel protein [Cyclobacterium plantarum]